MIGRSSQGLTFLREYGAYLGIGGLLLAFFAVRYQERVFFMDLRYERLRPKGITPLVLLVAAAAMLAASSTLCASTADDRIESSFKDTYVYRTYLKDDPIKIKAEKGIVTLTGVVTGEVHKSLAQETVTGLPGVTRVVNKLETKAEIATENADSRIKYQVMITLLFHRNVNATETAIGVKDGVVTLKGKASSMAQKELTGEYAGDIDGVKEVKNEMVVLSKPGQAVRIMEAKVDDGSITAQVRMALLIHRSTSAVRTTVSTLKGEVTLKGIAKNEAEKSQVTKLVTDIVGVAGVKNEMSVEAAKAK